MYAVIALLLASLASAQAIFCNLCIYPGQEFCCHNIFNDDTTCCSSEQYYYKGGFLDQKTLIISVGAAAAVILAILILCCCCCCSCCPCYRRRRQGAVYNSVVSRGPMYQQGTTPNYSAQYPPQPPSNPYLGLQASAPTAWPSNSC